MYLPFSGSKLSLSWQDGGSTPSRDRSVRVRGERDRRGRERPVFRTHEIGGRHGLERQIVDELPPCTSLQWRKLAAVNLLDHFDFVMSPIGGVGKAEADHKAVRCGFGILSSDALSDYVGIGLEFEFVQVRQCSKRIREVIDGQYSREDESPCTFKERW